MFDLYTRIEELCKEKGINITIMCKESGVNRGTLTDIKMGRRKFLSFESLKKIADYFNVSVEYIAGKTNKKEPPAVIGEELEEDVIIFHRDGKTQKRKFTKEQMAMFMAMLDAIPETPKDDI